MTKVLVTQPSVLPLSELIIRINAIWERKGIKPKQHLSSPRPGAETIMEKRAHADRCHELPHELPDDMDLMIEAGPKLKSIPVPTIDRLFLGKG